MARLQPPQGYITAKEAMKLLDISDGQLYYYVEQGKLKRWGPPDRKHKFYKLSEVEALRASRNVFEPEYGSGDWRNNPSTSFEPARAEDMLAIVDMDRRIFPEEPVEFEWYARWYRKNPETFFVLRNQAGQIQAFVCLLPVERQALDRYLRDEIDIDSITSDLVDLWKPGKPLHVYIMAMGVDPQYTTSEKHEYGARLVNGTFSFLLELAGRGVEIRTITARSYKPDGIRIMRKMGIPQLRSPVPGKNLFVVYPAESGFPLLVRYADSLAQWKQAHPQMAPFDQAINPQQE